MQRSRKLPSAALSTLKSAAVGSPTRDQSKVAVASCQLAGAMSKPPRPERVCCSSRSCALLLLLLTAEAWDSAGCAEACFCDWRSSHQAGNRTSISRRCRNKLL
eukprot:1138008-Pelagomonas_calceolata.AAC.3